MTEKDIGQGGGGTTSSSYGSFTDQTSSFGDGQAKQASTARSPTIDIRQKVSEDIRSVKQTAQDGLADASDKAKDAAAKQKNMLADKMNGVAAAMDKIGGELEQGDQADIGRLARTIGSSVQKFADDIKDRDLGEIAGMAEDFGRKQPLAFLGVAAIAGLAASRFLTASATRQSSGRTSQADSSSQKNSNDFTSPSVNTSAGFKTEDQGNGQQR